MFIDSVHISNLRTITDAAISFRFPGEGKDIALPNVNLLLGNNGAGKSTILRGIALSILTPVIESAGYVPNSMVRRERGTFADAAKVSARLRLHAQDMEPKKAPPKESVELTSCIVRRKTTEFLQAGESGKADLWEGMFDDRSPAFLLVGYGATRRVESSDNYDSSARRKVRHLRYQRVSSLFEEHVSLTPLAAWLPRLQHENKGRWTQVVHLIDRLLPAPFSFQGEFFEGEYLFLQDGAKVAFPALSDGYKAYLGWITDLLYHVCMGCPSGKKLTDNRGVVLVDEIDLHLHPAWQRMVVPMISRNLPNLQFILTSHSPLVTGTLQHENIFVLKECGNGGYTVDQYEEDVHGRTAEQVLLSSYFNLGSTRAPEITEQISQLAAEATSGNPKAAIAAMKLLAAKSAGMPPPEAKRGKARPPKRKIPAKPRGKAEALSTAKG